MFHHRPLVCPDPAHGRRRRGACGAWRLAGRTRDTCLLGTFCRGRSLRGRLAFYKGCGLPRHPDTWTSLPLAARSPCRARRAGKAPDLVASVITVAILPQQRRLACSNATRARRMYKTAFCRVRRRSSPWQAVRWLDRLTASLQPFPRWQM